VNLQHVPSGRLAATNASCPITSRLKRVSSSFWNRSSRIPCAWNFKRSQGKRSPARALSGTTLTVCDRETLPIANADLRESLKRRSLYPPALHGRKPPRAELCRCEASRQPILGDDDPEGTVGLSRVVSGRVDAGQPRRVEQRVVGSIRDDQRQRIIG
jgi:hypothetical protein